MIVLVLYMHLLHNGSTGTGTVYGTAITVQSTVKYNIVVQNYNYNLFRPQVVVRAHTGIEYSTSMSTWFKMHVLVRIIVKTNN